MKTVTYECDRCGNMIDDHEQAWNLAITIACEPRVPDHYPTWVSKERRAQWCRPCMEHYDLVGMSTGSDAKRSDPPPTIEELVREIVREELPDAD